MQGLRSALHTQAPAHSLKFTRSAIEQALGASVEELFEEFEEQPVASGSIGQVYQAKLSAKGARNTGIDPGGWRLLTPYMLQPWQLTRPSAGRASAFLRQALCLLQRTTVLSTCHDARGRRSNLPFFKAADPFHSMHVVGVPPPRRMPFLQARVPPRGDVLVVEPGHHAGIVVAVKVRHPGVSQAIQRDFALMMRMARIASIFPFIRELRLEDTLAQFAAPLREQASVLPCPSSTCIHRISLG